MKIYFKEIHAWVARCTLRTLAPFLPPVSPLLPNFWPINAPYLRGSGDELEVFVSLPSLFGRTFKHIFEDP